MSNIIPEKLTQFRVYADSDVLLGIADVTLPPLEFMTTEIKGAGIAGTIDSPGGAAFSSLVVTLNWRITTTEFMSLGTPGGHVLDMYAEHLLWDSGLGQYNSSRFHIFAKAITKKLDPGKFSVMESQDGSSEHEAYYLKIDIDSVDQLEIDKYNFIYRVKGIDYLADTRRAIGMI